MSTFLSLKNWERFQHYKDRDPPWVKLYRDMLTTESWLLGSDLSRLLQLASTLLAARYQNEIPFNFSMIKKVCSLNCSHAQFKIAIAHLAATNYLEIHGVENDASTPLAPRYQDAISEQSRVKTKTEESRAEKTLSSLENSTGNGVEPSHKTVESIFDHWRTAHQHPRSQLDLKRRKLIRERLHDYSAADLCQSISGFLNSPHHMGDNDKATRYDDIELLLRDSKHVDMGLKFYAEPPRTDLSTKTRRIIAQTEDWEPPEVRNAKH